MKRKDNIRIRLLWRQVQETMDRIDKIAEQYSPKDIDSDVAEATVAARRLNLDYVVQEENEPLAT